MFLKKSFIAICIDITMAALSFVFAFFLRVGFDFVHYKHMLIASSSFAVVCGVAFFIFKIHKASWRYVSTDELVNIVKAVTVAVLVFLPVLFILTRLEQFPRSLPIINWFVLIAFTTAPRILYRLVREKGFGLNDLLATSNKIDAGKIPTLLIGLNDTALNFLKDSRRKNSNYGVVAIVDENDKELGRKIQGTEVLGSIENLPKIIRTLKKKRISPQRLLLSNDKAHGDIVRKIVAISEQFSIPVAKLPSITDFKSNIDKLELKPIAIEDLLGRPQNSPNFGNREQLLNGKRVLVTGAGGTIGSELVRQIARYNPKKITFIEISEFNLYQIDKEISDSHPDLEIESLIGDVRDLEFLENIFDSSKPEIVFHAAALKHVPIVEGNIAQAALTNIIGSKNVADMSVKHNAAKMVMISTDKAVHPSSLMGVTKRAAELYIQALGAGNSDITKFSIVRFGNVLGSSGSVIPLFQKQLENMGPITVTHPDMTRFFMTVSEAVELVLQASTISPKVENDESAIFVLDMGEPVRITDLAKQMIKLAGFEPGKDIKIEYTGIRPGEKLYEVLFYNYENQEKTVYEGITLAKNKQTNFDEIHKKILAIAKLCSSNNSNELVSKLVSLVPEYINENKEEVTSDAA